MRCIWIGTSGWIYKHWAATFYPDDLTKGGELEHYAKEFPTVEINATFYRLPPENMVKGWRRKAPEGFIYAVKGSRYITHIKKLKDPEEGLKNYFDRLKPLKEKMGPILWQLGPNFHRTEENIERLDHFLKVLPKKYQHAVEFRHTSWMTDETFTALRKYNAAHVWLSSLRMPMDVTETADFVYLRFHGLQNGAAHDYTEAELQPWAEALIKACSGGKPAWVYFNNDLNTRAPLNAHMLMRMVGDLAIPAFHHEPAVEPRIVRSRRTQSVTISEPRSKRLAKAG